MLFNKVYKSYLSVAMGAALSLPLFTACENEVVDLMPVDKFSDETAYETAAGCELAVVGAYDGAQCGCYSGNGWTRG